jgi:hypothetical protein
MRLWLVAIVASAGIFATTGKSSAQFIQNHAYTAVYAVGGNDTQSGPLASSSSASGTGPGVEGDGAATASGIAGSYYSWFLTSQAHLMLTPDRGEGRVESLAQWSDILYLGNTDPSLVGQTLRLTIIADGFLSRSFPGPAGASPVAGVSINAYNGDTGSYAAGSMQLDWQGLHTSGWNSVSSHATDAGMEYQGLVSVDIPILRTNGANGPGSIGFTVQDRSIVDGQVSPGFLPSNSDFWAADPIQIQSITLPDVGNVTPESLGVSLTFDSGLTSPNIQTAPEPSSLLVAASGAGIAALAAWARPRRTR